MECKNFLDTKEKVIEWARNDINKLVKKQHIIEIIKNEKDILIVDMTFENCIAQLVVNAPDFAPYKYISFEAMTLDSSKAIKSGQPELICFFYDLPKITEIEIINELNFGVNYCSEFIPDKLMKEYVSKEGLVEINLSNLSRSVHPDDWGKLSDEFLKNKFVCVDVHCQYLVVKNNTVSLRVLPSIFV